MPRLDKLISDQLETRTRARDAIKAGRVLVNGKVINKPSFEVGENDQIEIREAEHDFVSRAGGKLEAALEEWPVDLTGKVCLDVGASTGGFTQVCLEHGARKVYALDVGTMQLSNKLREDERVVCMENTNARDLKKDWFEEPIDFLCMDVSFISAETILSAVLEEIHPHDMVILIKPQFELGPSALNKKGIVKKEKDRIKALEQARAFLKQYYPSIRSILSPVAGRGGNLEYLVWCSDQKGKGKHD